VDGVLATKSEGVGLIARAISFKDFQHKNYVITIHQRHRQTDRHTDGRTDYMRLPDRALHCSALRGNK